MVSRKEHTQSEYTREGRGQGVPSRQSAKGEIRGYSRIFAMHAWIEDMQKWCVSEEVEVEG